jgi:hypothetical protein
MPHLATAAASAQCHLPKSLAAPSDRVAVTTTRYIIVDRSPMFDILQRYGVSEHLVHLIRMLHTGLTVRMAVGAVEVDIPLSDKEHRKQAVRLVSCAELCSVGLRELLEPSRLCRGVHEQVHAQDRACPRAQLLVEPGTVTRWWRRLREQKGQIHGVPHVPVCEGRGRS